MKKGQGLGGFMAVLSSTFKTTMEKVHDDSDSDSTVTIASDEIIKDEVDISDHPKHTQVEMKSMSLRFIVVLHLLLASNSNF